MKREPRFAGWLREITVMGGSTTVGNMSAVGEANVFNDPEAAAVVFESGAPLRMVGLNVTRVTGTRAPDIEKLRGGGRVPRRLPTFSPSTGSASSTSSGWISRRCTMSAPSCPTSTRACSPTANVTLLWSCRAASPEG
jgi:hypothetical protein